MSYRTTIAGVRLRPDGTLPRLAGADDSLKGKLAQVEDDLNQLRGERAEKARARDEAKAAFAQVDGYDTDSDEYKRAEEAIKAVSEIDDRINDVQRAQVGILRMLGQSDPAPANPGREKRDPGRNGDTRDAWDGSSVLTDENRQKLEQISGSTGRFGNLQLGKIASRDALKAELGTADVAGLIQPDRRGLLPFIYRQLRLLDLIPSGTTDSNTVEYTQVTTMGTAAAETAEGALKPEESYGFTDADAPVRTIAAWVKVRKQTLADAAALRTFLDTALRYDVRRRLEAQIANGDGAGQNLRGILQTTGVQDPTVAAGESSADRIHHGIVGIQLADQEPNFVAVHPLDWEVIRLSRDDSGASAGTGGYLFGPPSQVGAPTIWGLPPVVSQSIPQGTALVGDARAAIVLVREGVNVLISDSDQDDFIKNRVTLLGEMRAGLVVWRPDGFATVNLGAVV